MPENEGSVESQDPVPIETGSVLSIAPVDLETIDIGLVMKTPTPAPHDLLSEIIRTSSAGSRATARVHPAADHADAGSVTASSSPISLTQERSRKTSIESRGVTVVTTSGTLYVTLLFGLTAGLTAASGFKLPGGAKLPLLLALIAFVIAPASA